MRKKQRSARQQFWVHWRLCFALDLPPIIVTFFGLLHFSVLDSMDVGYMWPSQDLSSLTLVENHRLYAARFNERLLGAVRVTLRGVEAELSDLCVREVTRRRGVGQYLVEETLRDNPAINSWRVADQGVEDRGVMAAFMQALGFSAQQTGWEKH